MSSLVKEEKIILIVSRNRKCKKEGGYRMLRLTIVS
jgi:hypothetical protein